jgi:hypothetical protein
MAPEQRTLPHLEAFWLGTIVPEGKTDMGDHRRS